MSDTLERDQSPPANALVAPSPSASTGFNIIAMALGALLTFGLVSLVLAATYIFSHQGEDRSYDQVKESKTEALIQQTMNQPVQDTLQVIKMTVTMLEQERQTSQQLRQQVNQLENALIAFKGANRGDLRPKVQLQSDSSDIVNRSDKQEDGQGEKKSF